MATRSLAMRNEKTCLNPPAAGVGMPPDWFDSFVVE